MNKQIIVQTHPKMVLGESKTDSVQISENGKAYTLINEGQKFFIPEGTMVIEGIIGVADILNTNDRIYPFNEYKRHISQMQESINSGLFGELFHPDGMDVNIERMTHRILEIKLLENGNVWGKFLLMDNFHGRQCQSVVKCGGNLPVSSRGYGSIDDRKHVTLDTLATWDIVNLGGFSEAIMRKCEVITEGKDRGSKYLTYLFESKPKTAQANNIVFQEMESYVSDLKKELDSNKKVISKMSKDMDEMVKSIAQFKADDTNQKELEDAIKRGANTDQEKTKKRQEYLNARLESTTEKIREMLSKSESKVLFRVAETLHEFGEGVKSFLKNSYTNHVEEFTTRSIKENNSYLGSIIDEVIKDNSVLIVEEFKKNNQKLHNQHESHKKEFSHNSNFNERKVKADITGMVNKILREHKKSVETRLSAELSKIENALLIFENKNSDCFLDNKKYIKTLIGGVSKELSEVDCKIYEAEKSLAERIDKLQLNGDGILVKSDKLKKEFEDKINSLNTWIKNGFIVESVLPLLNESGKSVLAAKLLSESYSKNRSLEDTKDVTLGDIEDIDTMLESVDNMTLEESREAAEGFEATAVFSKIPKEYKPFWESLSIEDKRKIEKKASAREFVNEKSVKVFWESQEKFLFEQRIITPMEKVLRGDTPEFILDPSLKRKQK